MKMKKENLRNALASINALVEDVKEFVKANGGIINTQNEECDTLYSYVVDWGIDEVVECKVLGVKVVDDTLLVLPAYGSAYLWGDVDITKVEDDEWYVVGSCGDSILTAQTILSIAECIDEYID
jgi:hypothetical protein